MLMRCRGPAARGSPAWGAGPCGNVDCCFLSTEPSFLNKISRDVTKRCGSGHMSHKMSPIFLMPRDLLRPLRGVFFSAMEQMELPGATLIQNIKRRQEAEQVASAKKRLLAGRFASERHEDPCLLLPFFETLP